MKRSKHKIGSSPEQSKQLLTVEEENLYRPNTIINNHDIKQLLMWMDQLELLSTSILRSRGWKFVDYLEHLFRSLIFKPRRTTVEKNIENVTNRYERWKKKYRSLQENNTTDSINYHTDIIHRTINQIPYTGDIDTPSLGHLTEKYNTLASQYATRNQDDLVSVIMPTFNSYQSLERAISSALNQKYSNIELIVVNDGSTDKTKSILSQYASDKRVVAQTISNSGPSRARNHGLKIAKGTYFAYLDADNEWYPEYLLIMVNTIKDTHTIDMAYCAQEVYQNNILEKIRFKIFSRSFLENTNYIDINSVAHKRTLYDKYGGFDTHLQRLEDWDLMLRYTQNSFPICVNCALVKYHRSEHSQNPLKNLNKRKARMRYQKSKHRIQKKIQKNKIQVKELYHLLPVHAPLYANLNEIETSTIHSVETILVRYSNNLGQLKVCVASIQKHTPKDTYHAAIIGHFPSESEIDYLGSLEAPWHVIESERGLNISISNEMKDILNYDFSAQGDVIVMDSCVVVTEGWLEALIQAKLDIPEAVCIVPRLVYPPYAKSGRKHVPLGNIEYEIDVAISVATQNLKNIFPLEWGKGYMELSSIDFTCALVNPVLLQKILEPGACIDMQYSISEMPLDDADKNKYHNKIVYTPHAKVYCFNDKKIDSSKSNSRGTWLTCSQRKLLSAWINALKHIFAI